MTEYLLREDAYLREAEARVTAHTPEGGIVLDRTVFYPTGGGQPGDSGKLSWAGGRVLIATAVKAGRADVALVPAEPVPLPPVGAVVQQEIDWERRHRHMRVHTALHLLSVVIPLPVSGGAITSEKGRLDFDMPDAPEDREALEEAINALIERDLVVWDQWISEAELADNPALIKTMSVKPPTGGGEVRLVAIGKGANQVDLQPCGGTHVARTSEIGSVRIGKIEKKGRQNRRVNLHLDN
ncbi:MAG: alanyl-tRNA editing protein [Pseudopelagicola sp.]|nr:alanyl-tRNA editing protein [Pseudopelagicola sp.]